MVYKLVGTADFSQGAECLPAEAWGRQCVPCCVMFLITASKFRSCACIETQCLNDILFAGSYLYCAMFETSLTAGLTDPTNMPESIIYKGTTVNIRHKGVFSGFMYDSSLTDDRICYKLHTAFSMAVTSGKYLILVFSGVAIGVCFNGSAFYIFDSHCRNEKGTSCPTGKCVLGIVMSLSDLLVYTRDLLNTICSHVVKSSLICTLILLPRDTGLHVLL